MTIGGFTNYILMLSVVGLLLFFGLYPPYIITSCFLIFVLYLSSRKYGLFSAEFLILSVVFIPSAAFIWANAFGADYINYHDHWLQSDVYYKNKSQFFVFVSAVISYVIIQSNNKDYSYSSLISIYNISPIIYFLLIVLFASLFYLTETGQTLVSTNYKEMREGRVEGAQFAGALAVVFWIIALQVFIRTSYFICDLKNYEITKLLNYFFIASTFFSMIWLFLHARRSELVGMVLLLVILYSRRFKPVKLISISLLALSLLYLIEIARHTSIVDFISMVATEGVLLIERVNIVPLPGGASNVYLTLLDSMYYFDRNDLLIGETFVNYLIQILPTNFIKLLDLELPKYLKHEIFAVHFSWKGGSYLPAVFYANFGMFGALIFAFFLYFYISIVQLFSRSRNIILVSISFFLIVFSFRCFWYELVTLIKPVLFLILLIPFFYINNKIFFPQWKTKLAL